MLCQTNFVLQIFKEVPFVPQYNKFWHSPYVYAVHTLTSNYYVFTNIKLLCVYSENYIFGKFDTFCRRLERIADMINTMEVFSGLGEIKIEGVDIIANKYKTIVDATKKKNYNLLDHRKGDVSFLSFTFPIS